MSYKQRQVVFVEAEMPDGQVLVHPYIIISCNVANSYEQYFTGVMITSSKHNDRFSFALSDSMFERPLEKSGCQARMKLILSFHEKKVKRMTSRMKLIHFKQLIDQIKSDVFAVDERD
jgi:hypothetical protein